jgi:hypothetical protein
METLPSEFLQSQEQITIVDNIPEVSSESLSLVYNSRRTPGHRYEFSMTSVELESAKFKEISARLAKIRNLNSVVSASFPVYCNSAQDESFVVSAITKGFRIANLTDALNIAIGDYFKFDGHAKVYQVVAKTGNQIEFSPNLVRNVNASERLQFNNVPFSFKIVGRPQEYALRGGRNSFKVEIRAVEVY